jgi:hypothetical protein
MTLLQVAQPAPPAPLPPLPPPLPPSGGAPGAVRIVIPGTPAPLTREDVAALRARRSELSSQLQSAASRRDRLARELRRSESNTADRAGLELRIQTLDQRILQLETDIAETGRLLALAPARATTEQPARPPARDRDRSRDTDRGLVAVILAFALLLPFAWGAARSIFRRPVRAAAPIVDEESRERLARLEVAVDAIAIEMERVAEGQRFVTRLLAESAAASQVSSHAAANGALPQRQPERR